MNCEKPFRWRHLVSRRISTVRFIVVFVALLANSSSVAWSKNDEKVSPPVSSREECVTELKKVFSGDVALIEKACKCFDDEALHAANLRNALAGNPIGRIGE